MSDYVKSHTERAVALLNEGNLVSARVALKRVLRREPDNVGALILYADLCLQDGQLTESENIANRLFDLNPDSFGTAQQKRLASVCMQNQLFSMGLRLFEWIGKKKEHDASSLYQEGICLRRLGKLKRARKSLLECVRLKPAATASYMQLGHVHRSMADLDRAAEYYKKFISLSKTERGTGYWCLADLKSYEFSKDEVAAMHQELAAYANNLPQLSALFFALGAAAEKRGDYSESIDNYRKGNDIQGKLRPFDAETYARTVAGLKSVETEGALGKSDKKPVALLIVGLPRSGTTLIEHILSAHSRVQATDELPFLDKIARQLETGRGYPASLSSLTDKESSSLRRQYVEESSEYLQGEADYFIDKNPENFLHIGLVKRMMPESIIIDARRDPRDVAISAYRQLFNARNEFASSFAGIYEYCKGYLAMINHWKQVYPGQIRTVHYERLVTSPENEIRSLLEFCGLEPEPGCFEPHKQKRAVMTPSVGNVMKPIFTTSIGQWRNFDAFASEELSRLATLIEEDPAPAT